MSCNPSIGGIGKGPSGQGGGCAGRRHGAGHGRGGIQFRILNSSKARPCAPRAQADRILYKAAIRRAGEPAQPVAVPAGGGRPVVEGDRVVGAVTQVGIPFARPPWC